MPGGLKELEGFLKELDRRLDKDGLDGKIPFYVFGGAAVVVAYGAPRATVDIDVLVDDRGIREKLEAWAGRDTEIALRHGIYFQAASVFMMPIEDPDWKERCVEILRGRLEHLRVMALGKEDLVLSKLGRYSDRDRADIQFLAETGTVDVPKLIRMYKSARDYYVGRVSGLDVAFNVVLEEHFGHAPLNFEKS